ncbi:MAG: sigma factor-like helix-turn-helix DNA-binding protein [Planctomycetota bacterium]
MPDGPSTATHPAVAAQLKSLLDDLDPTSRCVILLHYADELTLDEIAAVVEQNPADIQQQLDAFRARAQQALAGARPPLGYAA